MANFLDTLGGLKEKITGSTVPKVLGAPQNEVIVRAPAIQRGAAQQAAGKSQLEATPDISEVNSLFWGDPKPGGGVTILTSKAGFALLRDDNNWIALQTARRIAAYVMAKPRWMEAQSDRSQNSVTNEILCHAFFFDEQMSIEYFLGDTQTTRCLIAGYPLENDPPSDTPAPPDDVPV